MERFLPSHSLRVIPFSKEAMSGLAAELQDLKCESFPQRSLVVGLSGGSATGKSTVVLPSLRSLLGEDCQGVGQDSFWDLDKLQRMPNALINMDHPDFYRVEACAVFLNNLKAGRAMTAPVISFAAREQTGEVTVVPSPYVMFEGLYGCWGALKSCADVRIYVEARLGARILCRALRNRYERYNKPPGLVIEKYLDSVLPAHRQMVRLQRQEAHVIIRVPLDFDALITKYQLQPCELVKWRDVRVAPVADAPDTALVLSVWPDASRRLTIQYKDLRYGGYELPESVWNALLELDLSEW